MLTSDLPQIAQVAALSVWLDTVADVDLDEPSCLPGWRVRDLIVHLGGSLGSVVGVQAYETGPGGPEPQDVLTIADYLAHGPDLAETLAERAVDMADSEDDPRAFLLGRQQAGIEALDRLGGRDRLLQLKFGLMPLSAYLDARLVEAVVHTMDLAVSLPEHHPPHLFRSAVDRVVTVLREVLTERADDPVAALAAASRLPGPEFIAVAAGRRTGDVDPDLQAALPLL